MARHGFGRGEYKYFAYPLPDTVAALRAIALSAARRRSRIAGTSRWGSTQRFPADHAAYLKRCHAAGQARPTPLLLQYGAGDYNCLHQDVYGELVFPLQVAFLLSRPGEDFTGGEFVLTEQRPRMQSRAEVVPLTPGRGRDLPGASPPGAGHARHLPRQHAPRGQPPALGPAPHARASFSTTGSSGPSKSLAAAWANPYFPPMSDDTESQHRAGARPRRRGRGSEPAGDRRGRAGGRARGRRRGDPALRQARAGRARRLPHDRPEGRGALRRQGEEHPQAHHLLCAHGRPHGAHHAHDRRDRDDRVRLDRDRDRGAAARGEPDQAAAPALQRADARRQVVPLHPDHGGRDAADDRQASRRAHASPASTTGRSPRRRRCIAPSPRWSARS